MRRIKDLVVIFATLLPVALALTGCVKVHVNIVVNSDGSGTVGMAMGMTDEAKALMASEAGGDLFDAFGEAMTQSEESSEVIVQRWTEGDYEWAEGVVSFTNLDELNAGMQELEIFESFRMTKQTGLLKDLYILDAEITASESTSGLSDEFDFDPSGLFEARMTVTFPGEIVESNGTREGGKDSNSISWALTSDSALRAYAVSERWNWARVVILVGGILLFVLAAIGLVVLGIVFTLRERPAMQ